MKRVIVIEDDDAIRANVVELLTAEGFHALAAEDGRAGVRLAMSELPDLVVCDIGMPELDGYGVLTALRANPATAYVPFVFLSAKADRDAVRTGMSLGADDYVTKPFTRTDLLDSIRARL